MPASSEPPNATGSPGNITGRVVISSCSLANVTSDPEKLTAPTRTVNAVAARSKSGSLEAGVGELGELVQLEQRDQRRGAAADTVEQRHQLRHLRHLHPLRAHDADHGPDRDGDEDRHQVVDVVPLEEHHHGRQQRRRPRR